MSLKTRSKRPSSRGTMSIADPTSIRTRFATPVRSKFLRAIAAVSGFHSTVTSSPSAGRARASHVPEYPIAVPSSSIRFARTAFARILRSEPSAGPTIGQSSLRPCSSTTWRAASPPFARPSIYASISSNTIPGIRHLAGVPAIQRGRLVVEGLRPALQSGRLLLELGGLQPHARGLRAELRRLRAILQLPLQIPGRCRGFFHALRNEASGKGFSHARVPRIVKVYLEAYGCTQNYGEARLMQPALDTRGHGIAPTPAEADANVIVTCTVIETTERKMLQRMQALAAEGKPLVVAGCMAAAQRDLVHRTVPEAKLLPPRKWPQIVDLLGAGTACGDRAADTEAQESAWRDAIVPIAQGCAGRCTYCITRVARGRVLSIPIEEIVSRVEGHVFAGIRDIKLTGQDTAAYGMDTGTSLAELLNAITRIPEAFLVRVGLLDPLTALPILDDLIRAYSPGTVYKFLHLPVQSGDDGILDAMKREHTVAEFERIVAEFRRAIPEVSISTDIIVGFPGETEEAFDRTMDLLRRVRPDTVNITRFSPRAGTPSAPMRD